MRPDVALNIARLRFKAKVNYEKFHYFLGRVDCGVNLLKEINPVAAEAASKYNEAMTELRRIDPKCPEFEPL